jgi:hypothetical protein
MQALEQSQHPRPNENLVAVKREPGGFEEVVAADDAARRADARRRIS